MKKAQTGVGLRRGQYKRLGRLEAKNPTKAAEVADRMIERKSRVARGKAFASPLLKDALKLRSSMKKGGKVASKKK